MRAVFIHGACVRDGAWWWSRAAGLLQAAGVDSAAVLLPSCGETGADLAGTSLDDDVAAVRRVLADGEPAVLIGHSYGGTVATEAADSAQVRHLVYISSFLPDVGESQASFGAAEPPPFLQFNADGTFNARAEMVPPLFLQDCDAGTVEQAVARLARQNAAVLSQPISNAGWRSIPSTYLVCAQDLATPPELQRSQAARAGRVVELPTGHHPFLSRPELVVHEILAAAR